MNNNIIIGVLERLIRAATVLAKGPLNDDWAEVRDAKTLLYELAEENKSHKQMKPEDMYMDDASCIALQSLNIIQQGLAKFNIVLTPAQEDDFFNPIMRTLENHSNQNYRNEN